MDPNEVSIQNDEEMSSPVIERQSKSSILYTVFFSFLVIAGQSGQNIVLPLWADSGKPANFSTSKETADQSIYEPFMDNYFVSVFSSFVFAVFFGVCLIFRLVKARLSNRIYDRRISHKLVLLAGVLSGLAGVLVVFTSNGTKTAPYLQAILMNISIPATLVLRYVILKKSPTKRKLICALATFFSLVVCLLPSVVPKIDPKHASDKEQGGATGWKGILWPSIFMMGFIITSLMYIIYEKIFQHQHTTSKNKVDIFYILFLLQLFQFVACAACFWMDAIPVLGNVDSLERVALNFWFGLRCTFGHAGCSFYPGLYAFLFVAFFISYNIGSAFILRYSEGAAFLAIVLAVVTPTGFLFWTLFKEQPSFHWHPELSVTAWLNIAALVIMVPSIYLYNAERDTEESPSNNERNLETSPLLRNSSSS